ncbi:ankyrin repeat and SAM domain-containing protein 1A-like [Daphnia pulicaria]|uniref:ankyrin repeat and SAM domain-containing protein 1A-like n=1 Tax=Daphnia pulicaria TaxID=35523 RepID=UPI001EE9C373|nr:ankyrin repeat and SAM domain-containing protein 1A-like [Daphnia pulicaria]
MGKDQEFLEAARNGNVIAVEKLLSSKAKRGGPLASLRRGPGSNVQDSSGYSALHHASLNGHREIVVLLLEHEASANIVDSKGSSPLHLAAWAGHSDIVRLLLTTGVRVTQINLKNKDNETALHCGAQYGHTGVVNLLLKYGADPSIRNVRDETGLDLAAQYGRLETVELLLQSHPELIEMYKNQSRLEEARTISIRAKTSPLHAASRNGHRAVVDALLAAGFPVSLLTQTGTALHEAALCGKVDVVRRLLDAGIDVSLKDSRGFSALRIVQDLPTVVVQEITNLIQNGALSTELSEGDLVSCSPGNGMPFRFPTSSFSPGSPYENVSISSSGRGENYERESRISVSSCASTGADSFITLPRRRSKMSSSSCHSQRSECSSSVYEIPPPPRSLPWLQQQQQQQQRNHETDGEKRSSSQSDLLDDDSAFVGNDDCLSRSYDERSIDFLSDNQSTLPDVDRNAFKRSSHTRHSADQYLPMTAQPATKVSPNPPQKPPRKLQGMSVHYESLPRCAGRQKPRHSLCYSVDTKTPSLLQTTQVPAKRNPAPTGSSSGYELVYLARTGSRAEGCDVPGPRFRVESTGTYVEMAGRAEQPTSYENVELQHSSVSVDDDSIYDIPRELGGSKAYENVSFHPLDRTTSSFAATSISSSPTSTTPESPGRLPNLPPTPDHPPPPAHLAEQSIHLRIRPLSEEFKRKSRDMETETEEELFLAFSNGCDTGGSSSNGGSVSVSLSMSDKSLSVDNMEEVVSSDQPYEGLLRGSVPGTKSSMDRPTSLPTRGHASFSPSSSVDRHNDPVTNGPSGGKRTSLSVLSPFDEAEEWSKILEILNTCNSGLDPSEDGTGGDGGCDDSHLLGAVQREFQNRLDAMGGAPAEVKNQDVIEVPPIGNHGHDSVADWLLSLGFQHYLGLFIANGFDDVDFLGDGIVDDSSLMEIGVLDSEHRRQLVKASMLLKTPLHKMNSVLARPETVDEWLHLLRLNHYGEQFHKNRYDDMERVARIWEVELTTVVEIRLVGHLRRMLVSLGGGVSLQQQQQQRPSKLANGANVPHPVKINNPDDLTSMSSDLKLISSNLARLEDEISQKMIETIGEPLVSFAGVNETCNKNNSSSSSSTLGRRKSRPAPQPPSSVARNHSHPVELLLSELAIRNPTELVIGIAKTVATQWRHKPQNLLRPGVCYEAQYLGSTLVRHVRGTESTKRSIQKLKKKKAEETGKRTTSIVLAISLSGVQFLDPFNQETICKHEIRNINWACQDADDLTHFAYITKDQESTQDHFCHVFQVHSMDLATEVILTLGQAFEVAYQLVLRQEIYSPSSENSSQPSVPAPLNKAPVQQRSSSPPLAEPVLSTPKAIEAVAVPAAVNPAAPSAVSATNNKPAGRFVVDPARKIGPKPTVLPPKPKLGTALLNQRPSSHGISHARSHSSVDGMPVASGAASAMMETRLLSESNLASLQASNRPTIATMISLPSSASISSTGSGRAPLAAKDEL